MNWYRALFRLWVGIVSVSTALMLLSSVSSAIYTPQTNDASEFALAAAISAAVGLFGAWILRGLKGSPQ